MKFLTKFLSPLLFVVLLMPVMLGFEGCSAMQGTFGGVFDKPLMVTGESLNALGQQFVATGALMNKALDAKQVTVEQYRDWAAFAKHFKEAYPKAVEGWKAAAKVNDAQKQNDVGNTVVVLTTELMKYVALVLPRVS